MKARTIRRALLLSLLICGWLVTSQLPAANPKTDSTEPDYSAELPRIAPKSPEESLKSMRLKAGFHAEIVAAEPLIRSPMAMDFDEFGRAFVVELPEYNQYGSLKPHGKGAIKRLEDTDGDGRFDKATVYVDDLNYPTAVACWDGGILVGVAPDILFCKDTDGDGRADVRRTHFTGFGQDKAGEGMLNSFRWRIDNRFHIPTGLDGGEIVAAQSSEATKTKPINVRGQHLLLEPRGMTIEATSGGGQHGMSLDDWNLRGFVCGNSEPVHLLMYDGRYLARNPYLQAPAAAINIAPEGKFTKLMRLSEVEPWRVLRTRLRKAGAIPGSDEGGTASGFFTGATGITVYRGDAWPSEFRGQLFVGEVANNLVYRARLEPNGVGMTAHRADPDAEFLASTDNWFRPVQFANAPDGTLYVLDMYRELIEGAAFLAPQILKHMDASAGADKGRIFRIAPDGFQFKPASRLGDLPTVELVRLFEHPNAWHRDTASRLIYQRQDRVAVAPLRQLAATSPSPLARVMALYSLQGLSALEPSSIVTALKDPEPKVREHALRLAESFADQADVREAVLPLADDSDQRVRYQAAFTLGAFSGDEAARALGKLAARDGADSWMQLAILSSVGQRRGEFLALLLQDREIRKTPHGRAMLGAVASQIGAANVKNDFALFLRQLDMLSSDAADKSLAEELVKNLVSKQPSVRELLSGATGGKAKEIIAAMIRDARAAASDEQKSPTERATAVRTLATAN
ncbi:MAG: HEAT repeat domain-containing protein, partial [Planctomycetaceae bacterium]|nr:HEAT repeat domain-containing protein [Planctomycetaceae bacterium]